MFDHVTLRVSDLDAATRHYATLLDTLGVARLDGAPGLPEWENDLSLAQADAEHPATRNLHLAFFAPTEDEVRTFWQAGLDAGLADDGEPGPRAEYGPDYFGGFLRDADGNSVEAVLLGQDRRRGQIDHLWIRVADVAAARDFYAAIAPYAGIRLDHDAPERAQFRFPDGSFSLVAGAPTEHVHLAFGTDDDGAVAGFHATATALGHADNGAPGERPEYHPGYFAAFVLDPDGNNVELVNHHRP
jgi:catechol 2,3-dioxygenase-like lactoylglutathione lyase family enzyme